jgi:hypothetical protein
MSSPKKPFLMPKTLRFSARFVDENGRDVSLARVPAGALLQTTVHSATVRGEVLYLTYMIETSILASLAQS